MLAVFVCIAILHFASLRIMNLSSSKKKKVKKLFTYFYGLYFLGYGVTLTITNGPNVLNVLFIGIGLVYLVLNYRNTI